MEKLGAPLGVVVWDKEGTRKYKTVKQEVSRLKEPGFGISYRRMQHILCNHAMAVDPACEMPLEEHEARQEELEEIRTAKAVAMLQAAWRGRQGRSALGVSKGASKSEKEQKADAFKKKFVDLMKDPSKKMGAPMKALPGPPQPPAAAAPAPGADAPAVTTAEGPGVQLNAQASADTEDMKNVFR